MVSATRLSAGVAGYCHSRFASRAAGLRVSLNSQDQSQSISSRSERPSLSVQSQSADRDRERDRERDTDSGSQSRTQSRTFSTEHTLKVRTLTTHSVYGSTPQTPQHSLTVGVTVQPFVGQNGTLQRDTQREATEKDRLLSPAHAKSKSLSTDKAVLDFSGDASASVTRDRSPSSRSGTMTRDKDKAQQQEVRFVVISD